MDGFINIFFVIILIIFLTCCIWLGVSWNFKKYLQDNTPTEIYPISKNCSYLKIVSKGFKYMKRKNIVICGLARNIESRIDDMIRKLELLGSNFKSYKIVIVENDSTDLTRELLLQWKDRNPNVIILGCGINTTSCNLNLPTY